ncbi:MAG: FAD-dependent oxidoreductase [Ruminococcus sp.]|nr:FAD-dependent oxidoreductase [Candidatus Copronaster equi]
MYDIIIIGGGPAGLTAALYAGRANKSVLIIEKGAFGGQITYSPKVENIPGFNVLSGNEFAEKLVEQVLNQGAEFESDEVLEIKDGNVKTVVTEFGEFQGKAVILATGAKHRVLNLENESSLIGNGISFCAVCDGAFYKDKIVGVVGGGNSALQEAILLSELAKKVYVVQNLDFLTGEKKLCEQLEKKDNVEIILGSIVAGYIGENELAGIKIQKSADGSEKEISLDGLFLAVGLEPQNEPFENNVRLDERGYVQSGEDCLTDCDGIFAAGDCRQKRIRQVTTAAADGAVAALAACDYIDKLK